MAKKKSNNYNYIITRARYKSIKAFDHQQMESFCTDIYKSGYEDGRASVPGIDLTAIYKAIGSTKGIGPKKLEEIKQSIEAIFEKPGEDKEE
ncbi:MAG: glutathione peroxidase [Roseburia sp.]|nr:glutathione peroxidase [Roseburia sp.]MCM1097715.1 glutathione peroxidase [Ruminococcus flavefaciens]MCM1219493.1 glutathione peroxidase [Lachnospiraceae bacterium]